jgi:DNA topoisomerase-2
MYVGSAEARVEEGILFSDDDHAKAAVWTISPIFLKVFDEVFVNALDAAGRDENVRKLQVAMEADGQIKVENDGRGIPIEFFGETKRYIPEVVFSEMNSGSNFEDNGNRLVGGRNGVGVVCANVWSTRFRVEIWDACTQRSYAQLFAHNMTEVGEPEVQAKTNRRRGLVRITFTPDYARLGIDKEKDFDLLRSLVRTRCQEGAICVRPGVTVTFDGAKLADSISAYGASLFGADVAAHICRDEAGSAGAPGMQVAFVRRNGDNPSSEAPSFVNGIRCPTGTHVRLVHDRLVRAIQSKAPVGVHVRAQTVRDTIATIVVCRIPDPAFSSQAKDCLTTPAKNFKFPYDALSSRALVKLQRMGVLDEIFAREAERDLVAAARKTTQQPSKTRELLVDKYDPALLCRSNPLACTLIVTEGDSAKELAVAGLSVLGREHFGVFPLRGVPLNVRNVPVRKSLENKEISTLLKILNVAPGRCSQDNLRYGRLAIMSDQDLDGSHIAALIVNCVQHLLPELLVERPTFICRIVTPLLRAFPTTLHEGVKEFFSQQELDRWLRDADASSRYRLKYYKGLGTNSASEARSMFSDIERHTITLGPTGATPDTIGKFFDESRVHDRKKMLTELYDDTLCVDYDQSAVTIDQFLDNEVIHFSQYHVRRALASSIDGLTPARRKVLFYFLSLPPTAKEVKVAQAAAGVAQKTCYHHGEASLIESIVGSSQEHVGTNNVALLEPLGQFGSRNVKPTTHAAARYIFTRVQPVARLLFPAEDSPVLAYAVDDGETVEPKHFVPVVPFVLLNGASGIGTGFSTSVPSFSFESLVAASRAFMDGVSPLPALVPHYEGFRGKLDFSTKGVHSQGCFVREAADALRVLELPIGKWTETFLSDLKDAASNAKPLKAGFPLVTSVSNMSTTTRVNVLISFASSVDLISDADIISALKLKSTVHSTFMYLFDSEDKLAHFGDVYEIVVAHGKERLRLYALRREHQIAELELKSAALRNKAAFVRLVVEGTISLAGGQSEAAFAAQLAENGIAPSADGSYASILNISLRAFNAESIVKLESELAAALDALSALRRASPADMWRADLDRAEKGVQAYLLARKARNAEEPSCLTSAASIVAPKRKRQKK